MCNLHDLPHQRRLSHKVDPPDGNVAPSPRAYPGVRAVELEGVAVAVARGQRRPAAILRALEDLSDVAEVDRRPAAAEVRTQQLHSWVIERAHARASGCVSLHPTTKGSQDAVFTQLRRMQCLHDLSLKASTTK